MRSAGAGGVDPEALALMARRLVAGGFDRRLRFIVGGSALAGVGVGAMLEQSAVGGVLAIIAGVTLFVMRRFV